MASMSDQERAIFQAPNYAHFTTLSKDGSPQTTITWVDVDGDTILVNTAEGRAKPRNARRDPRVALSIAAADNPFNWVGVRGTAVEVTSAGADAHIDALAKKYLGQDTYPYRAPGEERVIIKIRPDRVTSIFM